MLNSHRYFEELQQSNFSAVQARGAVNVICDALEKEAVTKASFDLLKQGLEHEIKNLESRLTIKLGAMLTVCVGVVTALLKLH